MPIPYVVWLAFTTQVQLALVLDYYEEQRENFSKGRSVEAITVALT